MFRLLLCLTFTLMALHSVAQPDSLSRSDTIGVSQQYGYTYYGATQLTQPQLTAILTRSPDPLVQNRLARSRWMGRLSTGLLLVSGGAFVGALTRVGYRSPVNTGLLLTGYGTLLGSLIPQQSSRNQLDRAILAHNEYLANKIEDYVPPVVYAYDRPWALTAADTITTRRAGFGYRYQYRGIAVSPGFQLGRLTGSLNDRDVNAGVRYNQTIFRISGLVGSVGRSLLTGYVVGLLLTRRYSRRTPLTTEFLATGLLCVGANVVLKTHANHVQRRWISRYNDVIRERYGR